MDPRTVRRSNNGTQVPRVFDPVESKEKGRRRSFCQEIIEIPPPHGSQLREDPLVMGATRNLVKDTRLFAVNGNPGGMGSLENLLAPAVDTSLSKNHLTHMLRPAAKCLSNRMETQDEAPGRIKGFFDQGVTLLATKAIACAAMPSRRPGNPIPSVVFALTPTSSMEILSI